MLELPVHDHAAHILLRWHYMKGVYVYTVSLCSHATA